MGQLFAWSLVSSLTLVCMYLVYKWMLAGENQHSFNRGILLLIYAASLVAPLLLKVDFSAMTSRGDVEVGDIIVGIAPSPVAAAATAAGSFIPNLLLMVYLIGIAGVLVSTVVVICRLMHIIGSGERRLLPGGKILVLTSDRNVAPFSWRRYIVMSRTDWDDAGEVIVLHEMRHLSARHWIDLLVAQVVVALQWYNPVAWLMREELKAVHEYQADQAVMASGSDIHEYQMLLIKKAVGARFPSLANSLNHSQLKKRVTMMYKNRSSAGRRLRSLALVPACAAALLVACTPAAKSVIEDASEATIDVSDSKDSENSPETIAIHSSDGKVSSQLPDTLGVHRTVYINDELKDLEALNALSVSEIEAITADAVNNVIYAYTKGYKVEKSKRLDANVTKNTQHIKAENEDLDGMAVYIDGKKKDADALKKLQSSDIKSVNVVKPENAVYVETNGGNSADVLESVEVMPEFPGGVEALMNYIASHIRYPAKAAEANIQGRVVVKFVVGEDGKVRDPEIERSVSEEIDAEAIRVVKSLPSFTPGKSDGKPVAVYYHLPINFKLQS